MVEEIEVREKERSGEKRKKVKQKDRGGESARANTQFTQIDLNGT